MFEDCQAWHHHQVIDIKEEMRKEQEEFLKQEMMDIMDIMVWNKVD